MTTSMEAKTLEVDAREEKLSKVAKCLNQSDVNLWELRELALTRGGFVNAETRRVAWCKLVGYSHGDDIVPSSSSSDDDTRSSCTINVPLAELNLIHQDVRRSILFHYDSNVSSTSDIVLKSGESSSQHEGPYQEKLAHVLESVVSCLVDGEKLYYYQGLHDVAGVFMYNLEYRDVSPVLTRTCSHYLRDSLMPDLKNLTWFLQTVLEPLLYEVDQELCLFLMDTGLELSNAVLSWLITWFTHDVHDEQVASRLVDAFVASHPLLPMYYAIAVLIHPLNRKEILETDPDPPMVHMAIRGLLSKIRPDYTTTLPQNEEKDVVTAQDLLDDAITILKLIPPDSIMSCADAHASSTGNVVDMDRADSVALLKDPPSWALASSTTSLDDAMIPNKKTDYIRAKLCSGVTEIMATTDYNTILSCRLEPSNGFVATRNGSIHKLCGKVLCHNLQQQGSRFLLYKKRRVNNCLVVALVTKQNVYALIYCWNYNDLFVYGVRQRKHKVKVFKVCHYFQSAFLGHMLGVITFTKAFIQVVIHFAFKMMAFLIALIVCHFVDTLVWKIYDKLNDIME